MMSAAKIQQQAKFFAIIFQKNAFFFIFGKFLTETAINPPQNACKDVFLTLAQRMAISQGESRNISPFYQQTGYLCARHSPKLTQLLTYSLRTRGFSVSQMSRMKLASILPWRGKARR